MRTVLFLIVCLGGVVGAGPTSPPLNPEMYIVTMDPQGNVLTADGHVWRVVDGQWQPDTTAQALPVPVTDVRYWAYGQPPYLIDTSDNLWTMTDTGWKNNGPPPGKPTTSRLRTWGQIKETYH